MNLTQSWWRILYTANFWIEFNSIVCLCSLNFNDFSVDFEVTTAAMSRPLHRGASGVKVHGHGDDKWDSQMKDKTEREEMEKRVSLDHGGTLASRLPIRVLFPDNSPSKYGGPENGFASDSLSSRSRQQFIMLMLKLSLVVIIVLALTGSFWWTLSISSSSQVQIFHGYRRLQEQLVSDLWDIGEISLGASRLKELEFCSPELENHVPCFNSSEIQDGACDRHCEPSSWENCLVQPPLNYKIPLRWPTGRDVIWVTNVKITAQEVLSSGSLTKRFAKKSMIKKISYYISLINCSSELTE